MRELCCAFRPLHSGGIATKNMIIAECARMVAAVRVRVRRGLSRAVRPDPRRAPYGRGRGRVGARDTTPGIRWLPNAEKLRARRALSNPNPNPNPNPNQWDVNGKKVRSRTQ